jgi:succinoglycan biosynthesis transport protein ExoP
MPEAPGLIGDSRSAPSPTLRELAATLFRHPRLMAASFSFVFLAVVLYGLLSPRYEAHLKVLLRRGRSDPIVSPQPVIPVDFAHAEISEEELNSEVELLRDENLLKPVVEETGLVWTGIAESKHKEEVERAVRKLARGLEVEPLKKSNLIQINYRSTDPAQAALVLSALSGAYVRKHLELQRPSGELQFFEQQAAEYARKLRQSEDQLVHFTQARGVSSAALERDIALQRLGEAEAGYRQIRQEQTETGQRISALRQQLASFPSRSVTHKSWTDNPQLLQTLKSRLLDLQLKRAELLTRYEPSYRLVQEAEQEIKETQQSIAAEALTPVRQETTDKDSNYEWARMELERSQVQEESLQARATAAESQIASLRTLGQLRQSESVAQQDLVRNAKAEEDTYLLYLRKREEARIGDALDERRILNVAIVEPPVAPALPVHPIAFFLTLGLGLASACSIGLAFAADYLDPTIRTSDEAMRLLEVQVLACLPEAKAPAAISKITHPVWRKAAWR